MSGDICRTSDGQLDGEKWRMVGEIHPVDGLLTAQPKIDVFYKSTEFGLGRMNRTERRCMVRGVWLGQTDACCSFARTNTVDVKAGEPGRLQYALDFRFSREPTPRK